MKNKEYSRFLRNILIFVSPASFFLVLYFIWDPFSVIRKPDLRYMKNEKVNPVTADRDYVSTTVFDINYPKYKYDSFIFGSSRSFAYNVSDWKKLIGENSSCYHFNAFDESLYALTKKIQYIDSKGVTIKNALLLWDSDLLMQDKASTERIIFQISPQLVNYRNFIPFHTRFIYAFFQPNFFFSFTQYKITGKVSQYAIKNNILSNRDLLYYDPEHNEIRFADPPPKRDIFFDRDTTIQSISPVCIEQKQKELLTQINRIFQKQNTNYKIVINPFYNQKKFNPEDLAYLNETFGKENVFDFSGINEFTSDYRNYTDLTHYSPSIATKIMEIVYKKEIASSGTTGKIKKLKN